MNINVHEVDMLINNVLLFNQHVFHLKDSTSVNNLSVFKNSKHMEGKENEIGEFGNRFAEEMTLTQFTNGNSHFHRSTFKGEVSGQLFVRFLRYYLHIRRLSNGRCGSCRNRRQR